MMFMLTLLTTLSMSFAYIPEYGLIASRAAEQHGRGAYQIEQEVSFKKEGENYSVKETWIVADEGAMRVTLEGRGALKGLVQGTFVYDGSVRGFIDANQSARNQRLGDDWLEPLLHFRSSKYFRSRLVNLKVAPAESLNDRGPLSASEASPRYTPPGFLRLSRTGGGVAWAIGVPPSVGQAPTVWIEQDQFVLRKYRAANQVVFRADEYGKYDGGFWYPGQIGYLFGSHVVQTKTLSVKYLGKLAATDSRLRASSLAPARDALKLPEVASVREFYSRFR